jgi:hypothetical protein
MLLSLVSQNMLELRFEEMPNLVLLTQLLERSCIIYQSNNHGKVSIRNYIFQNHIYFLVLNSTSIFVSPVYSYVGFELCLSFLKYWCLSKLYDCCFIDIFRFLPFQLVWCMKELVPRFLKWVLWISRLYTLYC